MTYHPVSTSDLNTSKANGAFAKEAVVHPGRGIMGIFKAPDNSALDPHLLVRLTSNYGTGNHGLTDVSKL